MEKNATVNAQRLFTSVGLARSWPDMAISACFCHYLLFERKDSEYNL
jgi:hypothetical protein